MYIQFDLSLVTNINININAYIYILFFPMMSQKKTIEKCSDGKALLLQRRRPQPQSVESIAVAAAM